MDIPLSISAKKGSSISSVSSWIPFGLSIGAPLKVEKLVKPGETADDKAYARNLSLNLRSRFFLTQDSVPSTGLYERIGFQGPSF